MTPLPFNEAAAPVVRQATPDKVHEPGYYGLPMLKRPLWGWEIALYFFSEGISSGAFILSTMADLFGAGRYESLIRHARLISLATLVPCPPLLIADLGRPERFHHMLRIFKPTSPMNLGAWALLGFSLPAGTLALREVADLPSIPSRTVGVAGLPFAFVMLAYPGVLLSATSNPLWARTRLLGALFAASSMVSASSALAIAAALDPSSSDETRAAIHNIEKVNAVAEAAALAGYLATTGVAVKPLLNGRYSGLFAFGAVIAGMALPAMMTLTRRKPSRTSTIASGLLSLAGALALKWALVHAGREAAEDASLNHLAARADATHKGWTP